jgi:predicted nuclease of predicted toxin-antitoxin system
VNARLLLDEQLSPSIAQTLQHEGFDVCCLRDRGLLKEEDHDLLEWAFGDDRILVTKNTEDFRRLALKRELHAGLVLLEDGKLKINGQLATLRRVLQLLERERDLVNRAVRVARDGTISLEELSGTRT